MRQYETMVLLSPELTDETVDEKVSGFEKKVTEGGGEILNVERWGKKRLAYPIQRQRHGIYFIVTYHSEPEVVADIERDMRIDEETWRYMTVRMDEVLLRKLEKNAKSAAAREREGASEGGDGDAPRRPAPAASDDSKS
ncbi:MAG: 30S ribosomal protein S6 [Nitrospinae bacterium]|nr:30S ribosomal protein S6 [Nitrospinota bacterium]